MGLTAGDLLSHLVELFDYRVKEVSFVDEGANLIPFLLTKNLTRSDLKKEAFEALLQTKVKNADKVVEVLKRADVPAADQEAVENVFKVLTGLTKNKSLTSKTLGEALAAAELADLTGTASGAEKQIKGAFDFIAEKIAVKMVKMLEVEGDKNKEMHEDDKEPMEGEAEKAKDGDPDKEEKDGDESYANKEAASMEAEEVNKRKGGSKVMKLEDLPITKEGELDIVALKSAKVDGSTITMVKSLWDQNRKLTSTLDSVNEKLNNEVELRVDKHYSIEADAFKSLKFDGLKDVLKKFGTSCPDDYPKLKSLLQVCADSLKPAASRDFEAMGGSMGSESASDPSGFYKVCKAKAVERFKDDSEGVALQKYWKTEEGRKDYAAYDRMVTNR
jgi:hypothetical protein